MAKTTNNKNVKDEQLSWMNKYVKPELRSVYNRMVNAYHNTATLRRAALDHAMGGSRDLNHECGYPDDITIEQYQYLYDREGVSKRVVTIFPEESWVLPPSIYEDEDEDETPFEEAIKDLDEQTALFHYLRRVDVLSGIGRFGILFFGIDDNLEPKMPVEGINLKTGEVEGTPRERKLAYLRAFSESVVTVQDREKDPTSPRFGKPTMYKVQMAIQSDGHSKTTMMVHWTRVLHVADNREHSETFGTPRMKADYNRLLDLRKTLAGSAEMFWKGGFPGYGVEVNPDYSDASLDTESIKDEMEKFFDGLQRYMAMEGVTIKSLQPQTSDPTHHIEAQVKAICSTRGIPYRIFVGSEKAELASTQDKKSWNERIRDRQTNYLTPMVIRPCIEWLQVLGVLPMAETLLVSWPDRDAPSDKEIADVAKLRADAMAKYVSAGVSAIMTTFDFFTKVLGYTVEEAKAIDEGAVESELAMDDDNEGDDEGDDNDNDDNTPEE
jgi:hypothetical protein